MDVNLDRKELDMVMSGGVEQAIDVAYATPVAPMLRALSEERQREFRGALEKLLQALSPDGKTMGSMASSVLMAAQPR